MKEDLHMRCIGFIKNDSNGNNLHLGFTLATCINCTNALFF